jgi:DNA processing protein
LIRDGARLVRSTDDILEALPALVPDLATQPQLPLEAPAAPRVAEIPAAPADRRTLQEAAALHQQILDRLGPTPLAEDQLIRDLGHGANAVSPALTDLELDGRITRQPGGLLSLVPRSA